MKLLGTLRQQNKKKLRQCYFKRHTFAGTFRTDTQISASGRATIGFGMVNYIDIYRRFGGASPACPTPRNREINFDSFVRAGEAELRGCVRDMPPQRWASGWGEFLLARSFCQVVAAIRAGFKWF